MLQGVIEGFRAVLWNKSNRKYAIGELGNTKDTTFWSETLEEKDVLGYLNVDGRITLNCMLTNRERVSGLNSCGPGNDPGT
jgi:hypothetical protein